MGGAAGQGKGTAMADVAKLAEREKWTEGGARHVGCGRKSEGKPRVAINMEVCGGYDEEGEGLC